LLKVLKIEGEGEFEPGIKKQETLAKAKLDVLKYTNDEMVHELVMLLPADKPTDKFASLSRLPGKKVLPYVTQKTDVAKME